MRLLGLAARAAVALALVAGCSHPTAPSSARLKTASSNVGAKDVWHLVDDARGRLDPVERTDGDAVAEEMTAILAHRDRAQIVAFAQPLSDLLDRSYRVDLWAAAYLINGGASDDGFDYFRGWLISQGQTVYDEALADPDSLAKRPAVIAACGEGDVLEAESILDVASEAHVKATGEDLPADAVTDRQPELDIDFDFEDHAEMQRRLPRLTALCYPGSAET